ncbi:hypothetical protein, partial [Klebsiella pneumoniae]|uniref:hypothetical protein n=1 Tax=Klebsiella pneumoniae TaxID=573 RepID=UPI003A971811
MSLWDALRMNMMISYQELVRTFLSTHIRSNRTADGITVQYSHASRYLSYKKALLWRFPSPLAIRTFSFPQAACLA